MSNKLIKGISSCALAAMLLSTGAAAQVTTQDGTAAASTENISFSDCVEKIRSVYIERYPEQVEVVNGVIDEVTSNETFLECYEYEGKTAFRILEDTLMDALTPTVETYNYDGKVAWTSYTIPVITQRTNYHCGVASTLMALIGNGKISNLGPDEAKEKQKEIAREWGISDTTSANITLHITPYMNRYYSENATHKYRVKCFTINTYDKITKYLSVALQADTVPIMMIPDTSFFEYYKGNSYPHYMVVKKIDTVNRIITVVDPHYDSRFNGEHTITYDELYDVLRKKKDPDDEDIWLSVYTPDTLGYWEYIY